MKKFIPYLILASVLIAAYNLYRQEQERAGKLEKPAERGTESSNWTGKKPSKRAREAALNSTEFVTLSQNPNFTNYERIV